MTLLEQILQQVKLLSPEKQRDVLDFATFLRRRSEPPHDRRHIFGRRNLRRRPAKELGVVDAVRFLKQFTQGYGNYTQEREILFGKKSLDEIVSEIEKRRKSAG